VILTILNVVIDKFVTNMKKITLNLLVFVLLIVGIGAQKAEAQATTQGYKIEVKIKGLTSGTCLLANYYGTKQYLKDSAVVTPNGMAIFKGKETLPNGIYLVVLPNHTYTEIVVSPASQFFSVETDTLLSPHELKIKNSKENELFYEFNRFAADKGRQAADLQERLKEETDENKKSEMRDELRKVDASVAEKRTAMATDNANLFIGKIFKAMTEIVIPEPTMNPDGSIDSNFRFNYYRDHYWDNIDLSEDGLMRTPVYQNKLEYYMTKLFIQIPDTIIKAIETLMPKVEKGGGQEIFKYTVWWNTNHYEESKIMCMDKVLHYMISNYYCAGKAFWADSALVNKMCDHAKKIGPTLCGNTAPDLTLIDTSMNPQTLSRINKPVTIVVFWDHQCGHCKKDVPALARMYDSLKGKGLEIYAVYTQGDYEGWKQFVKDNKLNFINVGNQYSRSDYREKYNILTTPEIFILDSKKIIRFKKVAIDNVPGIVEYLINEQEEAAPKK
jgi:peroxiredoxin